MLCSIHIYIQSVPQEIIVTQEEYGKLSSEFHHYRQQVQGEMALLQVSGSILIVIVDVIMLLPCVVSAGFKSL